MEKDTDVVFLELLQKGLNRFKKAPPKKNKVKDGYNADKAKEAAPPSTEILSRAGSIPKDNLFERVPSTLSRLDTNRSGRSEGDANPSTRPASGKSQKSGRWDSIHVDDMHGRGAGDDFDAPITSRSGRSRMSVVGGMLV